MYICDLYDQELKYYCQRYSNNSNPAFTDREIMTIYLFAGHCQKYFRIKDIYNFASEYLPSRFPKLPSYRTFNLKLNRLNEAFRVLSTRLISSFVPADCNKGISLVDSLPHNDLCGQEQARESGPENNRQGILLNKEHVFLRVEASCADPAQGGNNPLSEILDGHSCRR